jgi:hypothetical protein
MLDSLRALLSGIIDYAGMFPPARLDLRPALENYCRYRRQADAWMLGRFVCPTSQLVECGRALEAAGALAPLPLVALARGGANASDWDAFRADIQLIDSFQEQQRGRAAVTVLEMKLPDAPGDVLPPLLREYWQTRLLDAAPILGGLAHDTAIFVETPIGGHWLARLSAAIEAIAGFNSKMAQKRLGFKLRCGGLEASAFPPTEQVALALALCREMDVPFKATAGLHHPIRRFDGGVQTTMHGFINVFGAGILLNASGLGLHPLFQILDDEDVSSFHFDATGFRWRDAAVTTADIITQRRRSMISFGSCSFDEPCDDIRALGWL